MNKNACLYSNLDWSNIYKKTKSSIPKMPTCGTFIATCSIYCPMLNHMT